ncbi:MAG: tetratricopeptide repeat protein [Bacteroidota bacterium]
MLILTVWLAITPDRSFSQLPEDRTAILLDNIEKARIDSDTLANALYTYVRYEKNFAKRLGFAEEGLALAQAQDSTRLTFEFLWVLGECYSYLGDFPKALNYLLDGLTVISPYPKFRNEKAASLRSIGSLYLRQENYPLAKRYLRQALQIDREDGRALQTAGNLLNLGEIYRLTDALDSALSFFEESLFLFDSLNQAAYSAYAYGNIGLVKAQQGALEVGQNYVDEAVRIFEAGGDGYGIASYKALLGEIYFQQGKFAEAEAVLLESLEVAEASSLPEQIRDASELLAEVYAQDGKYAEAYHYQVQFTLYNDSLTNAENTRQQAELRADYTIRQERLQNQAEVDQLKASSRFRGILAWVLGLGFSSIGILALVLVVVNRRKQQANQLLEEQKERIELKSEIIEKKNVEITSSIEYASRIQDAMLPMQERLQSVFADQFVLLKPKDIVSGDFYWMQEIGEEILFAVADSTGHGVPGALMSMLGMSTLNELTVGLGILDPGELLARLHEEIVRQLKQQTSDNRDGMDISLVSYHPPTKTLRYAGAKQPLVYVQPNEAGQPVLKQIKGDRIFVGGDLNVESPHFQVHSLTIDRPTWLYLFTDGFQDQFGGPKNKKFRPAAFRELLIESFSENSFQQKTLLDRTFDDWKGNEEQLDDILVVGIKLQ